MASSERVEQATVADPVKNLAEGGTEAYSAQQLVVDGEGFL